MSFPGLILTAKGEVKVAKLSVADTNKGIQLIDIQNYRKYTKKLLIYWAIGTGRISDLFKSNNASKIYGCLIIILTTVPSSILLDISISANINLIRFLII